MVYWGRVGKREGRRRTSRATCAQHATNGCNTYT